MKNLKTVLLCALFAVNANILCQELLNKSFQNFFREGKITNIPCYNFGFDIPVYNEEGFSTLNFSFIYPVLKNFELGGKYGYTYVSKRESGFTDLTLVAKYGLKYKDLYPAIGAYLVFDTGSLVINTSNPSKGIFASVKYEIDNKMELNIVLNRIIHSEKFYNSTDSYHISDNSDQLGVGFFYKLRDDLGIIFEVTENDYPYNDKHRTLVNLGANYNVESIGIFRAAFGIDLNDYYSKFLTIGIIF